MRQLPLSFSYQAPGKIWQLQADSVTKCLAVEVRTDFQDVSFSYLCPAQDKVIFEGLALEGALLSSLLACHAGILLLQQYEELDNPASVTLVALDTQTQQVLWAVEAYRHHFFFGSESLGKSTSENREEESWVAIQLVDGSIREVGDKEMEGLLADRQQIIEKEEGLYLPAAYEEGEENFEIVAQFLQMYLQLNVQKTCEYLHVFDKIAISFYTADGEMLSNHLAVFDSEGNLLLHQLIADTLHKPGSDTFMIWDQHLFFLEKSTCLKGYNLQ